MYERFTDRARKVMQLANQEAQRFNHEYVGTEHLLLGIIKDGGNVAAFALRELGLDLRKVRLEVEKLEKLVQSGPDMVTLDKLLQTPRLKKAIERAMEISRDRNDNHVGTEHLVLAIAKDDEGVAGIVLKKLEVTEERLKAAVDCLLPDRHEKLKQLLEQAVGNQDFETAAKFREQIKALEDDQSTTVMRAIVPIVLKYLLGVHTTREAFNQIKALTD